MNLCGKVISIDLETTAKGQKGEYPAWELIYKDGHGEVKTLIKHLNSMKYNKPLANGLSELTAGDEFTIEQEKNDGGYWDPKVCYKGIKKEEATPAKAGNTKASGGNSTYPTSDERKVTQTQIVRQSSLGHAVNMLSVVEKKAFTAQRVIEVAKQFEAFVHNGDVTPALPDEAGNSAAEMNDDIPY